MARHHSNAVFGEHVVVKPDESIEQLVLLGGTADIQGTVERDVVVIGGSANVGGTVRGQLVLVDLQFLARSTNRLTPWSVV